MKMTVELFYEIVEKLRFNNYIRLQIVNRFWDGEFDNEWKDVHE